MVRVLSYYFTLATPAQSPFFFFNDTATTEIYTLSLHDALPISRTRPSARSAGPVARGSESMHLLVPPTGMVVGARSEEHTSELQSHLNLVCRLLLEKKKKNARVRTSNRMLRAYRDRARRSRYPP